MTFKSSQHTVEQGRYKIVQTVQALVLFNYQLYDKFGMCSCVYARSLMSDILYDAYISSPIMRCLIVQLCVG